jgi:uncharacterized protein (TIGR03437 family)
MRFLFALVFLATVTPAAAQWTSLATNNDGSQVYFVSTLQQSGSTQLAWGKLFIADQSGVRALLIRNRDIVATNIPPLTNFIVTNAYNVLGVDVATDGSRLSVAATGVCTISSGICDYSDIPTATTVYDANGNGTNYPGRGRLSPNGEWLSLFVDTTISPFPVSILNLNTNSTNMFPVESDSSDYTSGTIANNGEFAFGGSTAGETIAPAGGQPIVLAGQSVSARLDAAGDTLVWIQTTDTRQVVMVAQAPAFAPRVLFSGAANAFDPSISSDGTEALFLTADQHGYPQAFLIGTDGARLMQITSEAAGITSALLSPDGQAVIAVGEDGSLLRFRPATGERDQIIGPTFALTQTTGKGGASQPILSASPGQVIHVTGTQLASPTVQVSGANAPIIDSAESFVDFQVPWQTPLGSISISSSGVPFTVTPGTPSSAWQGGGQGTLNVMQVNPAWVLVAHQNFAGLVTSANPAMPGEVINLYASGFGPVTNQPPDGQPAPDFPLSMLLTPLNVDLILSPSQTVTPTVLFAGLAPGTVGYYQVSIQLPSSIPAGVFSLQASVGGLGSSISIPAGQ